MVHGTLITALESPRASIAPLARHFGFDAVESEGVIRFQPRDRGPVATLALDDLVPGSEPTPRCSSSFGRRRLRIPEHPITRSDDIRSPIPGYPIIPACRR